MTNQNKDEVKIIRTFDAPRELVWKAWTEPETFKRWWGPEGFTAPAAKIDLRVGGKFHGSMKSPEGQEIWSTGTYREIKAPERLVMTDSFADEHGNVVPASHYGMGEGFPLEMLVTVTFEERDGKTRLILQHSGVSDLPDEHRSGMEQGWSQSFDKLDKVLQSEKEKTFAR